MSRFGADVIGLRIGIALACACWSWPAAAQERDAQHRGVIEFTYQYQEAQDLVGATETFASAPITTHALDFNLRYAIKDRWTVNAGLPLISRKWEGGPSHDPMFIIPPHPESEFVDDGHFHTFVQDLRLGAAYLVLEGPIIVEPYVRLDTPASDYPFFAGSAVGQHLQRMELGTTIGYRPPFLKWFFGLEAGHVWVEEPFGINVDTTRVDGEAVYFVSPRLFVRGFFSSKNGKGISVQRFDRTTDDWYHHDQTTRHNYINAGAGVDWVLSDRNVLNFTMIRMVHAEDVFDINTAFSVTLGRRF